MPPIPDAAAAHLVAVLLCGPNLVGARCAGGQPLWDEWIRDESMVEREERIDRAIGICAGCPAREPCRELRDALPGKAGGGVWCGELVVTSTRPTAPRRSA